MIFYFYVFPYVCADYSQVFRPSFEQLPRQVRQRISRSVRRDIPNKKGVAVRNPAFFPRRSNHNM